MLAHALVGLYQESVCQGSLHRADTRTYTLHQTNATVAMAEPAGTRDGNAVVEGHGLMTMSLCRPGTVVPSERELCIEMSSTLLSLSVSLSLSLFVFLCLSISLSVPPPTVSLCIHLTLCLSLSTWPLLFPLSLHLFRSFTCPHHLSPPLPPSLPPALPPSHDLIIMYIMHSIITSYCCTSGRGRDKGRGGGRERKRGKNTSNPGL